MKRKKGGFMKGLLLLGRYALGPLQEGACTGNSEDAKAVRSFLLNPTEKNASLAKKQLLQLPNARQYLLQISKNTGKDWLSVKVIEAYFVGNILTQKAAERKSDSDIIPHHNFHVLMARKFTVDVSSINRCLVRPAVVLKVDKNAALLRFLWQFERKKGFFALKPVLQKIFLRYESQMGPLIKEEDMVTVHRDIICQVISKEQQKFLKDYTLQAIQAILEINARGER